MMRAISLWQPWASLMANKAKRDETRNGVTKVRGEVAICASLKWTPALRELSIKDPFFEGLCGVPATEKDITLQFNGASRILQCTPLGCVVAVGELYDSITSEEWMTEHFGMYPDDIPPENVRERTFGNYSPGRGVWRFRNMQKLVTPIPVKGAQQWFNLPPAVEAAVRAQLLPESHTCDGTPCSICDSPLPE